MTNQLSAYISGMGYYLPKKALTNQDLYEKITNFDTQKAKYSLLKKGAISEEASEKEIFDLWVQQVSGIKKRHFISSAESKEASLMNEYMAFKASEEAIKDADIDSKEIDHIIYCSFSSEMVIPAPACSLQNFLGLMDQKISGITLNTACSGFMDGLIDAVIKVSSGFYNHVLVVASEYVSNKINFDDPLTCILFGDSAGAFVVSRGKNNVFGFLDMMRFNKEHICMLRGQKIQMGGGPLVQRKAVNAMSSVLLGALERSKMSLEDLDYIIPHQANLRILNALEERLNLPEKCHFVKCIEQLGNLSSATIPVAMNLLKKGKLKQYPSYQSPSKIGFTAVGGGYSFASLIIEI